MILILYLLLIALTISRKIVLQRSGGKAAITYKNMYHSVRISLEDVERVYLVKHFKGAYYLIKGKHRTVRLLQSSFSYQQFAEVEAFLLKGTPLRGSRLGGVNGNGGFPTFGKACPNPNGD